MRFQINDKDIDGLIGRFIIELDLDTRQNTNLADCKKEEREFLLAKRVAFVTSYKNEILECDFWGVSNSFTREEYVQHFNSPNKGKRFTRLLTGREMEVVFQFMKERQY